MTLVKFRQTRYKVKPYGLSSYDFDYDFWFVSYMTQALSMTSLLQQDLVTSLSRVHKIIVLGNEKGGSGKSTTAMHLIAALLRTGSVVGVIDLDARQGTLSRYLENRRRFAEENKLKLPQPKTFRIQPSDSFNKRYAEDEEKQRFENALYAFSGVDYIVIDTPGSDSFLSRLGHTYAHILVTPINDSFVDLDLLARVDLSGKKILGPSLYAQMVWEQRQERTKLGLTATDWVIMRNRLSHLHARNKQQVGEILDSMAKRFAFRIAPGFGERVIYRELFLKGLTLLDLKEQNHGIDIQMSHLAAKQELQELLTTLGLLAPSKV